MFNKSAFFTVLFTLLGFTLKFASATPPACVLACVDQQEKVYDYKDICKTNVASVTACLKKECDSKMYDDAITNYKASCKEASFNVVIPTAVPSSTSVAKATDSSIDTHTHTSTPTPTSTGSNSSSTDKPHDNSAPTVYYNSMLALIAVFATALAL